MAEDRQEFEVETLEFVGTLQDRLYLAWVAGLRVTWEG